MSPSPDNHQPIDFPQVNWEMLQHTNQFGREMVDTWEGVADTSNLKIKRALILAPHEVEFVDPNTSLSEQQGYWKTQAPLVSAMLQRRCSWAIAYLTLEVEDSILSLTALKTHKVWASAHDFLNSAGLPVERADLFANNSLLFSPFVEKERAPITDFITLASVTNTDTPIHISSNAEESADGAISISVENLKKAFLSKLGALNQGLLAANKIAVQKHAAGYSESYYVKSSTSQSISDLESQIADYSQDVVSDFEITGPRIECNRLESFFAKTEKREAFARFVAILTVISPNWKSLLVFNKKGNPDPIGHVGGAAFCSYT
jgi:hypothetical protein